jgi:hypothetical protein
MNPIPIVMSKPEVMCFRRKSGPSQDAHGPQPFPPIGTGISVIAKNQALELLLKPCPYRQ